MNLARWERIVEGPLNIAAFAFLIAYSWRVIGNLQGAGAVVATAIIFLTWIVYAVNYVVSLALAADHGRWFSTHVLELLIVALPILRPLRLLRYVRLRRF